MRFVCWPASLAIVALLAARGAADEKLGYNRSIRPILAENCFACHGPGQRSRKAELRLDKRDAAIEGEAIVPGKPTRVELIKRINDTDPEEQTCRRRLRTRNSRRQKGDCSPAGSPKAAEYQPHWSFIAPDAPRASGEGQSWVRNPIDAVRPGASWKPLARSPLPKPIAARSRDALSLDLTGLPPTPAAVEAFVADTSRRRLRALRRSTARVARLGRTSRPLLARRGPLRRHPRHPLRQLSRDVAVSRLGDSARSIATCPSTSSRSSSSPAICCRTPRSISRSPPASIAATSRPTKAA